MTTYILNSLTLAKEHKVALYLLVPVCQIEDVFTSRYKAPWWALLYCVSSCGQAIVMVSVSTGLVPAWGDVNTLPVRKCMILLSCQKFKHNCPIDGSFLFSFQYILLPISTVTLKWSAHVKFSLFTRIHVELYLPIHLSPIPNYALRWYASL